MSVKSWKHVLGRRMAYAHAGEGPTLLFLHGNPTSSHLWRHAMGALSGSFRCLAPDLIGMGDSDKLPAHGVDAYGYETQRAFLHALLECALPDGPVVLVTHDWGHVLGVEWARSHPERVRAIAYMEPVFGSMPLAALPPGARDFFALIRSPAGEEAVLRDNLFVERMVSGESTLRPLAEADREEYRRPFREPGEGRRPTLSFPRLLPYDGEPAEIAELCAENRAFLARSPMPKLFVDAEPGRTLVGPMRDACRRFPNQTEVRVPALHYPQEDAPEAVSEALRAFLARIGAP